MIFNIRRLSLLLLIPFSVLANPINENCPQFVYAGAPVSVLQETQYLCKTNYAVHYRYDTKTAEYVVEHIRLENITGPAKRKDDFRPDPKLERKHQSTLQDYAQSGHDRGHLAAGANNNGNDQIMSESFFLSNMVPQNPNHNRGIWRILEERIRDLVIEGKDIYLITGTVYDTGFKTLGSNKVGIPTQLWKVVVDKKGQKGIAFLIPNQPVPIADISKYVVSIAEVERVTGLNFHPNLASNLSSIETKVDPSAWGKLTR
jgi:endonuclease G